MKFTLGLVLTLIGLGIVLYGFGSALKGLAAIYSNALESPLDEPTLGEGGGGAGGGGGSERRSPDGQPVQGAQGAVGEKAISERMLQSVMVGAIGLPPLIIGSVLLKWALFSRWRRKLRERQVYARG